MKGYEKIIISMVSMSSVRMLIGAASTIYMVSAGVSLYEIGLIKSTQAVAMILLGFISGIFSDRLSRKNIYLSSILFSSIWLYLLFLAGIKKIVILFYLAEIVNAISLSLFQNNTNGYLIEQARKDTPQQELNELFGKFNKYSFFFMAIFSVIGGIVYNILYEHSFSVSASLMLLVFMLSIIYLPNIKERNKSKKYLNKREFYLIARKMNKYKFSLSIFILYSLFFQIIIQYWQVLLIPFKITEGKEYILGIILFLMFLVQSLSGKCVEINFIKSKSLTRFYFSSTILLMIYSLYNDLFFIFVLSLCVNLFLVRYTITQSAVILHKDLKNSFRSKYDMLVNFIIRILTALSLVTVGYISEKFGIDKILILGLFLSILTIFLSLKEDNKA